MFGQDWVVRQAVVAGMSPLHAWSMGSLHPATRYAMDGDLGGLGGGRRADLVLLDDDLRPHTTWYGGELVVQDRKITPILEQQLDRARYRYPAAAYRTVHLPTQMKLTPELPARRVRANTIRTALPGIVLHHDVIELEPANDWTTHLDRHGLCFAAVIERHGHNGNVAHGLLKDFGLVAGAVASSVGHDAHNIIVAGRDEADMQIAVAEILRHQGGVVAVRDGRVLACVPLPVAGLLSDKRAHAVAEETAALKAAWRELGCTLPFMGFNLIPLAVIPEVRLTDKGLVTVPGMTIVPLLELSD